MAKTTKNDKRYDIGGSIFWIFLIFIGFLSLIFIAIWGYINESIQAAIAATIFTAMLSFGVLMSRGKVFDLGTWGWNTLSFTIGFFAYIIIGSIFGGQQSTIGQSFLFATLSSSMPQILDTVLNTFLIPIAEELVWMIGIPFTFITIFDIMGRIGKKRKNNFLSFFGNLKFQIVLIILIGSISFAAFHVGKLIWAFIISAIVFRSVLLYFVLGDQRLDIIKGFNLVAGFAVGAHMANNIIFDGVQTTWLILKNNFWPVGLLVSLFFILMFASGIEKFIRIIIGKKDYEAEE